MGSSSASGDIWVWGPGVRLVEMWNWSGKERCKGNVTKVVI